MTSSLYLLHMDYGVHMHSTGTTCIYVCMHVYSFVKDLISLMPLYTYSIFTHDYCLLAATRCRTRAPVSQIKTPDSIDKNTNFTLHINIHCINKAQRGWDKNTGRHNVTSFPAQYAITPVYLSL